MSDIIICNVIFIRAINQKEKERKEAKRKRKIQREILHRKEEET